MTAFDTAHGRACDLADKIDAPALEGVTPLERIALADPEWRRLSALATLRWCEMSDEDRDWLIVCELLCAIAARVGTSSAQRQGLLAEALTVYAGHLLAEADPRVERAVGVEDAGFARLEDEAFEAF